MAAALTTIVLKAVAYLVTGSVGLLSDALESVVNLVGSTMALAMLTVAARPPDENHSFGHGKAEYFSSVLEGTLILIAAASIGLTAARRLIAPQPLEQVGLGLAVSITAAIINLVVARVLLRAGKQHGSISLVANSQHLMTDVWTSVGVVIGVGLVATTGLERLDPVVALLVAGNIVWTGVRIVRDSVSGLMDTALPAEEQEKLRQVLDRHAQGGVQYTSLRTRRSGARRFVAVDVSVPGSMTVDAGHQLLERIEADIRDALPNTTVLTHLGPLEEPAAGAE